MTEVRALIERLVDAGLDPIEAAEIITRAAIVGATAEPRSKGAVRQERYRRNKTSQNVTSDESDAGVTPPKESSPTPPKEITPRDITPPKPPAGGRVRSVKIEQEVYEEFEETVWADFPRHPNSRKDPAAKAYSRLSMEGRAACIRGAIRYAQRFWDEDDPKRTSEERLRYVPHLVTWINQKGWEVELERTH